MSTRDETTRDSTDVSLDAGWKFWRSTNCHFSLNLLTLWISWKAEFQAQWIHWSPFEMLLWLWDPQCDDKSSTKKSCPSFCSIMLHAPKWMPVLLAVVSKHNAITPSSTPHSCKHWITALAWAYPVLLGSFDTPNSCSIPTPKMMTGSLSTCSLDVKSCINFPSQWMVRGADAVNSAFKLLASVAHNSLT